MQPVVWMTFGKSYCSWWTVLSVLKWYVSLLCKHHPNLESDFTVKKNNTGNLLTSSNHTVSQSYRNPHPRRPHKKFCNTQSHQKETVSGQKYNQGAKLSLQRSLSSHINQKSLSFVFVMKLRLLIFRNTHPYPLADRIEDHTPRELIRTFL